MPKAALAAVPPGCPARLDVGRPTAPSGTAEQLSCDCMVSTGSSLVSSASAVSATCFRTASVASVTTPPETPNSQCISSAKRRRSPSSVIHANSQPWRLQRALRRASSQVSRSILSSSGAPVAFIVASSQFTRNSSILFESVSGESPLRTSAQKPQRNFSSEAPSPSVHHWNSATSPGSSFEVHLSAPPNTSNNLVLSGFGVLKMSVTSVNSNNFDGSSSISCFVSAGALPGLWSPRVLQMSTTQSERTPAVRAGPGPLKPSTRNLSPSRLKLLISSPTFAPLTYSTMASGNNLTFSLEQPLQKCRRMPVEWASSFSFKRLTTASKLSKTAFRQDSVNSALSFIPFSYLKSPTPDIISIKGFFALPLMHASKSKNHPASTPCSTAGPELLNEATVMGANGLARSNLNAEISSPTRCPFL
mmetsp:Transcript_102955/g.297661  ORF Transcript_102955/g.297661 Transcript_102955/m.297661 type:complete len:419 (-) Transcript_102955:2409-3665(-)